MRYLLRQESLSFKWLNAGVYSCWLWLHECQIASIIIIRFWIRVKGILITVQGCLWVTCHLLDPICSTSVMMYFQGQRMVQSHTHCKAIAQLACTIIGLISLDTYLVEISAAQNYALVQQLAFFTFVCSARNYSSTTVSEEGVQAYGGSYSSVTYSGNIRNEIGVMRFPWNEIAMSDSFEKQNLAPTVPKTVHANDLSLEICMIEFKRL